MNLPKGFRYSATYAGIRKTMNDDVALIVSDQPAVAAAMFTTNRVVAAPVTVAKKNLAASKGRVRALLVNAGNANCATRTGERVATDCVNAVARELSCKPSEVLPASTGVIGVEMNGALIVDAMPKLIANLDVANFEAAARAIMTTDTVMKVAHARLGRAQIVGMTKGSGMIHPLMATTLGFVMTDAAVSPNVLKTALKQAVESSYNRISVDGDTSTNDMVAVLANGASGVKPTVEMLAKSLGDVLQNLAIQIVRDGEGARKLVTIDVSGASSDRGAENIARAIANSPLVKTAIAGADPNWGRILSAAGNAGVAFDPRRVDIEFQGVAVCRGGLAAEFDEDGLKAKLDGSECAIRFKIRGAGEGRARFWTCDFTEEYIRINGSYRT